MQPAAVALGDLVLTLWCLKVLWKISRTDSLNMKMELGVVVGSAREGWESGSTGGWCSGNPRSREFWGQPGTVVNSSLGSAHRKLIPADPWEAYWKSVQP